MTSWDGRLRYLRLNPLVRVGTSRSIVSVSIASVSKKVKLACEGPVERVWLHDRVRWGGLLDASGDLDQELVACSGVKRKISE